MQGGRVYLVGAGPGAPGLLTLRGKALLAEADVVVYDALVNPALLRYARRDAEMIDAGKRAGKHRLKQEETNALLVNLGKQGKNVVRLKGGDPFLFGRGGEEAAELELAGIPYEVVPGITSAFAVPAYAGISPTVRGVSSSIHIFTAQGAADRETEVVDWSMAAKTGGTLIFMMGYGRIGEISRNLIERGLAADTPAAVVQWGTTVHQKQVFCALSEAEKTVEAAKMGPPAVLIIGEAARSERRSKWTDWLPLFGRSVAFTRETHRAVPWQEACEGLGARVFDFPLVQTVPVDPGEAGRELLTRLSNFDWIVFSNSLAVEELFLRLEEIGCDARSLNGIKIAAVGPETARTLRSHGITADLIPREKSQEGLAAEMPLAQGLKVLIPGSPHSRPTLSNAIDEQGGNCQRLTLYETLMLDDERAKLIKALEEEQIDSLVFATPAAAREFIQELSKQDLERLLRRTHVVCIGSQAARDFKKAGRKADFTLAQPTLNALIETLSAELRKG